MLKHATWVCCALLLSACAEEGGGDSRQRDDALTAGTGGGSCTPGESEECTCGSGKQSTRSCVSGSFGSCKCTDGLGNAAGTGVVTAGAGGSGGGGTGAPRPDCGPGTYVGTYTCMLEMNGMPTPLPLTGPVQFDLEINESVVSGECDPSDEFCGDLVIAEGSGTLFGFASFVGFETHLEGGLDCETGVFQATAPDGIWGFPAAKDPSDPMSELTVAKPPSGTFTGTLAGEHKGGSPQKIEGEWDLMEMAFGYRCNGPFTVELQP